MSEQFDISQAQVALENSLDAIVSANALGEIMYFNAAAEKMFGIAKGEYIGKSLTELMPEKYREAHKAGMQRYLSTQIPKVIGRVVELEALRKDGTAFPMEMSLSSWKDEKGEFSFIAIIREVSERKKMEQDLQGKMSELEKINKMMVDREMKMIELKQRIADLEGKAKGS